MMGLLEACRVDFKPAVHAGRSFRPLDMREIYHDYRDIKTGLNPWTEMEREQPPPPS